MSEVLSGPANGPYHPQNVQGDAAFDYASVAVDNSNPRRIIVGAVLYQSKPSTTQCLGYYINISLDGGSTWSGPTQVAAPNGPGPAPLRWGINARVVAAGNQFFVFLPELAAGSEFQPLAVYYYAETSTGWTLNGPIIDFSLHPPLNNTPSGELPTPVYYAPLIDASGSDSGTWAVSFQARTGGSYQYNNVYECSGTATTSNGCWAVNAWPVDQFMNGVNVDWMGGVWVSYLGFSANYQYKLLHQVQYFPPGGVCGSYAWCGTTGDSNVDPRSWTLDSQADRCGSSCYAMGDYARIGSNGGNPTDSSLGISAPYVNFSSAAKQLFQVFYYDPPGTMSRNSFVPNAIYYPPGTTLPGPSTPNPPETLGIAPELRRKPPGFNHM